MKTLAIEIPEDILFELNIPKQRWGIELRKELALQLYRENLLPFGHARCEIAAKYGDNRT